VIGKTRAAYVKDLTVTLWAHDSWEDSFATFRLFTGLKVLRISVQNKSNQTPDRATLSSLPSPGSATESGLSPLLDEISPPAIPRPLLRRILTSDDFDIFLNVVLVRTYFIRGVYIPKVRYHFHPHLYTLD